MKTAFHKTENSLLNSRPSMPFFNKSGEGTFIPNPKENGKEIPNSPFIQPKLTIGEPNDKYEKEADSMADKVVGMDTSKANAPNNGLLQKQEGGSGEEETLQAKLSIQKQEAEEESVQMKMDIQKQEEMEEASLQAKHQSATSDGNAGTSDIASKLNQRNGKGSPLSEETNSFMSNAFGTDFSNVNIHTGQEAVQMNEDLGARAFTNGSDIYFNKGEYDPNSSKGKHLLAHELTHVVQQNQKSFSTIQRTGDKGNKLLNDFAKDFKDAAELIKKSPEAMKLVKEALKAGVKYGGYAENGPGKVAWPYTVPSTKTVYVPKARTDKVIAMSDFIFELNNAISGKKLAGFQDEAKKGSKGSLTAKKYAYKIIEVEVDGILRTGKVGMDLKKELKEGKAWYKKYDSDFFLSSYQNYKDGKVTKDKLIKGILSNPMGDDPSKTHEQYYMEQFKSLSGGK